jgi:hypothetical protein
LRLAVQNSIQLGLWRWKIEARVGSRPAVTIFHQLGLNFSNELLNETELSSMGVVAVYLVRSEVIMPELEAGVGIERFLLCLRDKSAQIADWIKLTLPLLSLSELICVTEEFTEGSSR